MDEIVIALSVILSSGAVLRAAGRIWLGWGSNESSRPETGTADDPGEESEDESDTADSEGKPGSEGEPDSDGDHDGRERSGRRKRVPLTMVLPPLALLAIGLGSG